ncbi:hypothetical protein B0H66DRAFT_560303 [Apodospora peruviana]|uniref:Chromo domain-containing protein n=1 Tax=Apodospora peruviana TaxID=516989 RepID=A0AAE0I0L2_9PEZI|nr:hypothetical protein B0H66DRAFT_560303 [Apodospora peruviana]
MPPAVSDKSDSEGGSDVEQDAPTKVPVREKKKPVAYKEEIPDDEDEDEEVEEGAEGDGDDEEPEEYVVEKICSHMIGDDGEPLFEVKWEGYEKKSDRTWEPEDNLKENASVILTEYLVSIGGRDKLFEDKASALKSKKRGRPSQGGTPNPSGGKRSRRNGDLGATDSDTPVTAKKLVWKPPAGSWEDHIETLDACEDEDTHKLMVYLTWKNGQKTQHETSVIYQRCPQKMLQFYERHVRIVKRDPEGEWVDSPGKTEK